MTPEVTLYSYWCSSCSWRVRAALYLKKVPYKIKPIDLIKEEQKKEEFLKINPLGKVPVLVVDGVTVAESLAIIEFIDEVFSEGQPLLPKDAISRAQARAIALQIVAAIQPLQNMNVISAVEGKASIRNSPWGKRWIEEGFESLQKLLQLTAGKYCVGDTLTVADICLVPQVYNARRFNVDVSKFPLIERLDKFLATLPAFTETCPEKQPDALKPEDLQKLGL